MYMVSMRGQLIPRLHPLLFMYGIPPPKKNLPKEHRSLLGDVSWQPATRPGEACTHFFLYSSSSPRVSSCPLSP